MNLPTEASNPTTPGGPGDYVPPDPTEINTDPKALDFWSHTLNVEPEKLRQAVNRVGPVLDSVKLELGIGGV